MRMCGIRIRIVYVVCVFMLSSGTLLGQCDPEPETCNEADCGQVEIALDSDANNVFCQGEAVSAFL